MKQIYYTLIVNIPLIHISVLAEYSDTPFEFTNAADILAGLQ